MNDLTNKKDNKKFKHMKNIYVAFKEVGTTLEYRIIANVQEMDKKRVYQLEVKEGYTLKKVLCNEWDDLNGRTNKRARGSNIRWWS